MDVVAGETWYCVDRVGERGFALREATITRTFGSQVILAQDGISVQVEEAALRHPQWNVHRDALAFDPAGTESLLDSAALLCVDHLVESGDA